VLASREIRIFSYRFELSHFGRDRWGKPQLWLALLDPQSNSPTGYGLEVASLPVTLRLWYCYRGPAKGKQWSGRVLRREIRLKLKP